MRFGPAQFLRILMSTADKGSHLPSAVGDGGSVHYQTSIISLTAAGGEILRRRQSTFINSPVAHILVPCLILSPPSSFDIVGCAL